MNLLGDYARRYHAIAREHGQEAADAAHVASTPPGATCGAADHESTDDTNPRSSEHRLLPSGRGRLVEAAPPST